MNVPLNKSIFKKPTQKNRTKELKSKQIKIIIKKNLNQFQIYVVNNEKSFFKCTSKNQKF